MHRVRGISGMPLRRIALAVFVLSVSVLTGCANFYVDPVLKDVSPADMNKISAPKPVQLLFEFQTKGVQNSRATDRLRDQVIEQVKASGLFSIVDDKPVAEGAILSLTINNVPLTDDAAAKGFVTGLTLGLAGSQVSDGYVCTLKYIGPGGKDPIVKTERHVIHTVLGAKGAPEGMTKSDNAEAAVRTMTKQIVGNALKDLSYDRSFK